MPGSQRSGETSVIASTPAWMFRQNSAASLAPGNTAPMPTIATAFSADSSASGPYSAGLVTGGPHDRWPRNIAAQVDDLRRGGPCRLGELGEQAGYALVRVDERDAAPCVRALKLRGDHAAVGPRAPVDRDHPARPER